MSKKERILKLLAQGKTLKEVAKATKSDTKYVYYIQWMNKTGKTYDYSKKKKKYAKSRIAKKPSKIMDAVKEMKSTLDALDLIKDVDPVNHPPHYKAGGIETIDFIEAKDLNYRLGNVIKYVSRAGKKDSDPVQDLQKAAWYLQREIDARKNA
jgi:hypothetical protein